MKKILLASLLLPVFYVAILVAQPNGGGGNGPYPSGPIPANVAVMTPNGSATNTLFAQYYFSMPNTSTEKFLSVFQLKTNQSFAILGPTGGNLFGIRHDFYGASTTGAWEWEFGSPTNTITDIDFWMSGAAGAFVGWHKGGVLQAGWQFVTGSGAGANGGVQLQYASPELNAIDTIGYVTALDSTYGTFYPPSIVGQTLDFQQAAAVGGAAGTGGSVGVTLDANPTDVSAQITLVTGHTGTTTGTLVTYTLENYDTKNNAKPAKPVGSAANDAAANEIAKVSFQGTAGTVLVVARAALTIDTTYKWNIIIAK